MAGVGPVVVVVEEWRVVVRKGGGGCCAGEEGVMSVYEVGELATKYSIACLVGQSEAGVLGRESTSSSIHFECFAKYLF